MLGIIERVCLGLEKHEKTPGSKYLQRWRAL